jgi:hypothetical protein
MINGCYIILEMFYCIIRIPGRRQGTEGVGKGKEKNLASQSGKGVDDRGLGRKIGTALIRSDRDRGIERGIGTGIVRRATRASAHDHAPGIDALLVIIPSE